MKECYLVYSSDCYDEVTNCGVYLSREKAEAAVKALTEENEALSEYTKLEDAVNKLHDEGVISDSEFFDFPYFELINKYVDTEYSLEELKDAQDAYDEEIEYSIQTLPLNE